MSQERAIVLESLASNEFSPAARRDFVAAVTGQEQALVTSRRSPPRSSGNCSTAR
jgi:hypothetical protein